MTPVEKTWEFEEHNGPSEYYGIHHKPDANCGRTFVEGHKTQEELIWSLKVLMHRVLVPLYIQVQDCSLSVHR